MSAVTSEPQTHHHAAARVADRSGEPAATGGNNGSAKPTPGIANAPAGTLPNVKPDPNRASSPEIEKGMILLREGNIREGRMQIAAGIDSVVERLAGKPNLADYARVKAATDEILKAYGQRHPKYKQAVVDGVNEFLRRSKAIDGLVHAGNKAESDKAKDAAAHYVNDAGSTMSRNDRLIYLAGHMLVAGVNQGTVNDVLAKCGQSK
jgi:hypothetical protein